MKHIFLTPTDCHTPLMLVPKEDTLYILPAKIASADITLTLSSPGVHAFLLGLFHTDDMQDITVNQNHAAPQTASHVLLKSLVAPTGHFRYQGNVHILKAADGSNASQEVRGLLRGEGASFKAIPSLEILPKDVACTHKASSSPVNKDSLYILETKGFAEAEAKTLLETAFLKGAFDILTSWGMPKEILMTCEEKLFPNQ
jgi:Fe-S cluster assembly protein SufD